MTHLKSSQMEPNHALLVGSIWGCLASLENTTGHIIPTKIEVVMNGEEVTNEFVVVRPSGRYRVTVHPA